MRSRAFTLVELMVVIAIIGLLASVLATSVVSKMSQATHDLDKKTLQDLHNHIAFGIKSDEKTRKYLIQGPLAEKRGRELLEGMLRYKLLGPDMLKKLVSHSGNDFAADNRWLDEEGGTLPEFSCSWAAPQGNEVAGVFSARGAGRRVALCANSRNWFNFEDEVIVMWSDAETASYVTLEEAGAWGYAITKEQWQTPATSLFGTVKPFDGVFD